MTGKKYKYLVCDYDGTLVNDDKVISPLTLKAVNDFVSRGGVFVVCTGRMTTGIDHILKKAGLSCLLASYNGAELIDVINNKVLYRNPIDNKTCLKILSLLEGYDVNVQFYPNNQYMVRKETDKTRIYAKNSGVETVVEKDIFKYYKQTGHDSSKILIYDESEKLDKLFTFLQNEIDCCEVVRSNSEQIDINKKGISKGLAIKLIADYYSTTTDNIIAVGDAGNDVAMLKSAGFPIAMGNAPKEIKNMCKAVCPDNNSDGIKYVIDNYCI